MAPIKLACSSVASVNKTCYSFNIHLRTRVNTTYKLIRNAPRFWLPMVDSMLTHEIEARKRLHDHVMEESDRRRTG